MADNTNKNKKKTAGEEKEVDPSRREFMKKTGIATGGVIGGALLGGYFGNPFELEETAPEEKEDKHYSETRMFFTRYEDFNVLRHATERIFPEDDIGPGAIGLGVPYFIDKQLAGEYGSNKKDYMRSPAQQVEHINTYQTLMDRGEVFIEGLRKLNAESEERYDNYFINIEAEEQDALLKDMEDGNIELKGVASSTFFNLLRQMTIEGAYSDPLYGGNKDMQGWIMKEHPGIRSSYTDLIDSEEFQKLEPVSLKDYQQ